MRANLHKYIARQFLDPYEGLVDSSNVNEQLVSCLKKAFNECDMGYKNAHADCAKSCGSTAVVVLIVGNKLVCANLGDARAVLSRNGKALDLSVDYKASRKDEQERIKSQGGYIVFGRVLGRLAVTRAFGDFDCKQIQITNEETKEVEEHNFVLNEPEIRVVSLDAVSDDFVVLASDGLFDRFSSQECINKIREHLMTQEMMEQDPKDAARILVADATSSRINSDNTTCVIVTLNKGIDKSKAEMEKNNLTSSC